MTEILQQQLPALAVCQPAAKELLQSQMNILPSQRVEFCSIPLLGHQPHPTADRRTTVGLRARAGLLSGLPVAQSLCVSQKVHFQRLVGYLNTTKF